MLERRAFLKAAVAALGIATVATTLTPGEAQARMPEPTPTPDPVDPARHAGDEAVEGRRFFARRRRVMVRRRRVFVRRRVVVRRRRRFGW